MTNDLIPFFSLGLPTDYALHGSSTYMSWLMKLLSQKNRDDPV
jgi:hypothetical protein